MKDREAALTWSEGDATKDPTKNSTTLSVPSHARMEARVEAAVVALPCCSCALPDQGDVAYRCPISGPVQCPHPLGGLAPHVFFPSPAGLNDPAPHPAPAADSSGWNSFQVPRREPGKGWVEKENGAGKETPRISWLMLMYGPACALLPPVVG